MAVFWAILTKIGTQTINAIPPEICDSCVKIAYNYCVECDKSYCQSCLGIIHQLPKNRNHKLTNDKRESKSLQEFGPPKCVCPAKEYLSDFCFQCKTAICVVCLKKTHNEHFRRIPLEEIRIKLNELTFEGTFGKIKDFLENYSNFKKTFTEKTKVTKNNFTKEFNIIVRKICIRINNFNY